MRRRKLMRQFFGAKLQIAREITVRRQSASNWKEAPSNSITTLHFSMFWHSNQEKLSNWRC